ncbi:hypothetical protein FACS189493_6530 [Spirochaetia bacterium]|nr:hypothetical protein FACS189493_6530 [Spirochaetia bacterium]
MMQNEITRETFADDESYADYLAKIEIQKWKNITKVNIQYSEGNILLAKDIRKQKIKDSIHSACAIEAECKY